MTTVYVVTSGEYSSYGICKVCMSKEGAQKVIQELIEEDRQEYVKLLESAKKAREEGSTEYWARPENIEHYEKVLREWDFKKPYSDSHYRIEEYEAHE